jgi:hypothetical protein
MLSNVGKITTDMAQHLANLIVGPFLSVSKPMGKKYANDGFFFSFVFR